MTANEKPTYTSEIKVKASNHDSYGTTTIIAILLPLAGLIMGILYLVKDKRVDRKLGEHLVACSILASIVLGAAWYFLMPMPTLSTTTISRESSIATQPITPAWDIEATYLKLTNGMTKAAAEVVIEKAASNCNEQDINNQKFEACTYGGALSDNGLIIVSYTDGIVSSKTKQTY